MKLFEVGSGVAVVGFLIAAFMSAQDNENKIANWKAACFEDTGMGYSTTGFGVSTPGLA